MAFPDTDAFIVLKPDPNLIPIKWSDLSENIEDDCLIYLTQPYIKHYAGTVFCLGKPIGISGWEEDERLREKLNFSDKRTYILPDTGKGMSGQLEKSMTKEVPQLLKNYFSLQNGVWRITSMKHIVNGNEKIYDVVPDGKLPFQLIVNSEKGVKDLWISLPSEKSHFSLSIFEKTDYIEYVKNRKMDKTMRLFSRDWPFGFYTLILDGDQKEKWECTVIRLFPYYIEQGSGHTIQRHQTIW